MVPLSHTTFRTDQWMMEELRDLDAVGLLGIQSCKKNIVASQLMPHRRHHIEHLRLMPDENSSQALLGWMLDSVGATYDLN